MYYIVVAAMVLNSIAQLFLLPSPVYLAQLWFVMEKRSFVIGIGFYSNLLGFGLGGTLSSWLGTITVQSIITALAIIATISFLACTLLVKNHPKIRIESKKKVQWSHARDLWRQKFTAYNIVMVSVFLGVSWTFLSQCKSCLMHSLDTRIHIPECSIYPESGMDIIWGHFRHIHVMAGTDLADENRGLQIL